MGSEGGEVSADTLQIKVSPVVMTTDATDVTLDIQMASFRPGKAWSQNSVGLITTKETV